MAVRSPTSARAAERLLTVDEALERILARVSPLAPRNVPLLDAVGRTLAEDVVADRDIPPFRNSAMDGYAVRGADVASAPASLRVVGAVAAVGVPGTSVWAGEALRRNYRTPDAYTTDQISPVSGTQHCY